MTSDYYWPLPGSPEPLVSIQPWGTSTTHVVGKTLEQVEKEYRQELRRQLVMEFGTHKTKKELKELEEYIVAGS